MTVLELKAAAMECLVKAFKGEAPTKRLPPHVIQAAVVIVQMSTTAEKK